MDRYQELHFTKHSFASLVESDDERAVLLTLVNDAAGPVRALHLLAVRGKQEMDRVGELKLYLVPAHSMEDLAAAIGEDRMFEKGPHYNTTTRIRIPKDSVHARFLDYETGTDEPLFNCKALTGIPETIGYLERRHLITPAVSSQIREFAQQVAGGLLYQDVPNMKRMLNGEKMASAGSGFMAREATRDAASSSPHIII